MQLEKITNAARRVRRRRAERARDVLARLVDRLDLSNKGFPWLTAQDGTVGMAPVRLMRVNYVGELGWEIHHPIEYHNHIFDVLEEAGRPHGLKLVGIRAMNWLRLEKSYRGWGTELSKEVTACESGLDRFIRLDKNADFIGRDALAAQRDAGSLRWKLVTLLIDGPPDADPWGVESIWSGGSRGGARHRRRLLGAFRQADRPGLRPARPCRPRHGADHQDAGPAFSGRGGGRQPLRPGKRPRPPGRELSLGLAAAAVLVEAAAGYPPALLRRVGHPVMWAGALIAFLDRTLNREEETDTRRRALGVAAVAVLLLAAIVPAAALAVTGFVVEAVLASTLLAQRSLFAHVRAVERALRTGGVVAGRAAVAHIVGRNPATLDAAGVARAAIESLAENFSDGVVAPVLWCAVAGLPGMAAYKAVNTADSMIGHRTKRHAAFGWAAARLDDVLNLPASRLSALWLVAAALLQPGADAARAARSTFRTAGQHRSPNAGWPEAAMAGALGLRLGGPRVYGDVRVMDAWMGDGRAECGPDDIARALGLYRTACALQAILLLILALALQA